MDLHATFKGAGALLASFMMATAAYCADEAHTQHGAHQHGHGTLDVAIEKNTVSLELRVPGSDIVGFEHAPANEQEKNAIEDARARLSDPLKMFGFPKEAGCRLVEADVHTHGGDNEEKQAQGKQAEPAKPEQPHEHSSFHAKYTLTCAMPQAIKSLDLAFFAAFSGAQELEIVAVSEKGQVKAEATRATPKVSLSGLW